jgi:hypothetical protein
MYILFLNNHCIYTTYPTLFLFRSVCLKTTKALEKYVDL